MKNLEEIKNIVKKHDEKVRKEFGVKEIGIFGSYIRSQQTETSDIDILVEFKEGYKTFDNYMNLKFYLEELLNLKIDLLIKSTLKPRLKPYILKEVIYI